MKNFNIRVYGIIINQKKEVLVSDEHLQSKFFTKFPGGGLKWGEGTKDCLKRELYEELGLETQIGALIYVNDFFQESAFRSDDQLLSFYYLVDFIDLTAINNLIQEPTSTKRKEEFRWIPLEKISSDLMTFPIDKHVVGMLHNLRKE